MRRELFAAAGMLLCLASLAVPAPAARLCGDLDASGKVDLADVSLALRAAVGLHALSPAQLQRAGFQAGSLTILDVSLLLRVAVGLSGPSVLCRPHPTTLAASPVSVTTLVGDPVASADGPGSTARFQRPAQIAFDSADNLYVADRLNHRIRRVSPNGTVSTIAGSEAGYADGPALSSARFDSPYGVAVGPDGSVYVADSGNEAIRRVSPDGLVTTLAGNPPIDPAGVPLGDFLDGPALLAEFSFPVALAADAQGTLYIADSVNNRIRRLAGGQVSTLAGTPFPGITDGPLFVGQMFQPTGVALMGTTLVVADLSNEEIRTVDLGSGELRTLAGNPILSPQGRPQGGFQDGGSSVAQFNGPSSAAVGPDGTLYVTDTFNNRIRTVDSQGNVGALAGSSQVGAADGPGAQATFNQPQGIAVDSKGTVYVADTGNNTIRKITPDGTVSTWAGRPSQGDLDGPAATALLNNPEAAVYGRDGTLYIADTGNNLIRKMDATGAITTVAGTGAAGFADGPAATAEFNKPSDLAIDPSGLIYVADRLNQRIRVIDTSGNVSTLAGNPAQDATGNPVGDFANGPAASARFNLPRGLALAPDGTLFVADMSNNRIRRIGTDGQVTTVAGSSDSGATDGPADSARFSFPQKLALDAQGNLFVADVNNERIRKISPDGTVTTVAGSPRIDENGAVMGGYRDGAALNARFYWPTGIVVDHAGNVYVADRNNNRIRKIGIDGTVTTVAGSGHQGFEDGPGNRARFFTPIGLAFDAAGNLVVTDLGNSRIRKITLPAPG